MFKKLTIKEQLQRERASNLIRLNDNITRNDVNKEDMNDVAELTTIVAMDKDDLAEMLLYALQRIDVLEGLING